jgi:hypothetical protein
MARVSSREQLKQYCLRRLGYPIIEIPVEDTQLEDRISDAILFYIDYHYDAVSSVYYQYTVNDDDVNNRYVTVPDSIIGVSRLLPINALMTQSYMWDIRYQLVLNNLWDLTSTQMTSYYMSMQHISLLEQMFEGQVPIRFERHQNRVYIDAAWGTDELPSGTVIVLEAYQVIDPDEFTDVWNDRVLKELATAYIKRQYGENLIKYKGDLNLPGGLTLNGQKIYDDAVQEIERIEAEFQDLYSEPAIFFTG